MHPIRTVGIVGAGLMGRTIAQVNLERGLRVVLTDVSHDMLRRAAAELAADLAPDQQALLSTADALEQLAGCDLVMEAIVENLRAKKQLFARLEDVLTAEVVLSSNTSSLSINQLAAGLTHPERFAGLHFCHPVRQRPLTEIVPATSTAPATLAALRDYSSTLRMQFVIVRDTPGFVVNRVLHPYMNEALVLLEEGADPLAIDRAATDFGMPWGPLTQIDEIGIDVVLRGGQILAQALPGRPTAHDLLVDLFSAGRLGRKTGAGFYRHGDGPPWIDNEVHSLLAKRRRPGNSVAPDHIARRLFERMSAEAQQIVKEQVVARAEDVEHALVLGLGFPASQAPHLRRAA